MFSLYTLVMLYFYCKAFAFFIIILFYPVPESSVECLSIFLGQTDHAQSGKPMSRATLCSHPCWLACLVLSASCAAWANIMQLKSSHSACTSVPCQFICFSFGFLLDCLCFLVLACFLVSLIPQKKMKFIQTQELHETWSFYSETGEAYTKKCR